jgi:hypothetical protein
MFRQGFPTGKGFGGSSLKIAPSQELVFSIVGDATSVSNYTIAAAIEQRSPLVVEVGKIIIAAIWFWCLVGANFCFVSVTNILHYGARDL